MAPKKGFMPVSGVRFEPGKSGNPAGRPSTSKLLGPYIRKLFADSPDLLDQYSKGIVVLAMGGNSECLKQVRESLDGPAVNKIDLDALGDEQLLRLARSAYAAALSEPIDVEFDADGGVGE